MPEYDVLVDRSPQNIASQLLFRTDQHSPPVDLDRIVKEWAGISTVYANLKGTGYLMDQPESSACILVAKTSQETRRSRFTLAHEMGHWILHRFAERAVYGGPVVKSASQDQLERWCDSFASELLMPSTWVKSYVGLFEQIGRPKVMFGGPMLFDVSREAFYLRLEHLYRVTSLQITRSGRLTVWSRRAPSLRKKDVEGLRKLFSPQEWAAAKDESLCKGPFRFPFGNDFRWIILMTS